MKTAVQGYPRIGARRELKLALEKYWNGKIDATALEKVASDIRKSNWQTLKPLDYVPVGDFSLYDKVLDTACMLGVIPERFRLAPLTNTADRHPLYLAMARGTTIAGNNIPALEMTKWFNTNYHYLVPEISSTQEYQLNAAELLAQVKEAQTFGIKNALPILIGPLTFLLLSHLDEGVSFADHLHRVTQAYAQLLANLSELGISWVQLDEPMLVSSQSEAYRDALRSCYEQLQATEINILVQTYFDHVGSHYSTLCELPIQAVGLDFVHGAENLEFVEKQGFPQDKTLFAGLVDGRNVFIADIPKIESQLKRLLNKIDADRLVASTSCSLLHVPITVAQESKMPDHVKSGIAFAAEKIRELQLIGNNALHRIQGDASKIDPAYEQLIKHRQEFLKHPDRHNNTVQERVDQFAPTARGSFADRDKSQKQHLHLPPLPTTTIGSFPQTKEVRSLRRRLRKGELGLEQYRAEIQKLIETWVRWQEEIGVDVLVHGEFERNDMVEYFGEQLDGFLFTQHGWIQSYGSRCYKAPIVYGDVHRNQPLTVRESVYAQSLTNKPVKGMLTGPVTILNWSFVRDDLGRNQVCKQIALAIRDEVLDLEKNGIRIIQVDEPALREGLPLQAEKHADYLDWAVTCFHWTVNGVQDATQVHTHMCYSYFNDIMPEIIKMDADVISIENARSSNELLQVFREVEYPNYIGPGVYDIHSPNIPTQEELAAQIQGILEVLPAERVWINPDCGLKTRKPEEVRPSITNMVKATMQVRTDIGATGS